MSITDEQKDFQADTSSVLENPTIENFTAVAGDLQPVADALPEIVKETKAGWRTTEFWLALVSSVGIALGAVPTPHDTQGYALAVIVALYAIARGLAKKGIPVVEPSPVAVAPAATEADVAVGLSPDEARALPGLE